MTVDMRVLQPVPLWPDGAPAAEGSGPEDQPKITLYLPELPEDYGPTACMVVCPGGAYHRRAEHEGRPVAEWLCELGVAAAVLDYRVAPYRHPVPLNDALRAIRLVRHNYQQWNLDPDRIGILGFSAGGHLAASAGTLHAQGRLNADDPVDAAPSRPDAMILCYPVITMGPRTHTASMENLLGQDPAPPYRQGLSLEGHVTDETPPTFLWQTADDPAVPVHNSLLFAQALASHDVPMALHVFPHGRHGLGLAPDDPDVAIWTDLCASWLQTVEFAPKE
ncbi:MAG: alpha/beta hydrolase [Planctomycetota bacterium]